MKAKQQRFGDDEKAVTVALEEKKVVAGSGYGDVTWREWCKREMVRMNDSGDCGRVRIACGEGRIWLTRG